MYFFLSFDYTPQMIAHQRNAIFSALVQSKYGAQVSQHMRATVSIAHLILGDFLRAQSQVLLLPSSGMRNCAVPAASPAHSEQQLAQQFRATSGREHLFSLSSGLLIAHSHFLRKPTKRLAMGNFSVVTSPLQELGHTSES